MLGGVVKNETGHIIKARAIENYWLLLVNFSSVDMDKAGNMAGTGEWVRLLLRVILVLIVIDFISVIF